ncbi:MAG: acyltransferase [Muribaculaceae bacterium]|nr:acyltransferase [Muribaculaceae bacterium]
MEQIMPKTHVRFDKEMTGIIKGFGILFMMFLHCFDNTYDTPLDFTYSLSSVHSVFKICVGMFVFMVGYGYSFSKTKDYHYGVQHIKKLLVPFWTILFLFTFPFCFTEVINDDYKRLFFNLFGIDSYYNWYSWFVYFFIFAMLLMPFIARYIDKKPVINTAVVVFIAVLLSIAIHELPRLALSLFGVKMGAIIENKPLLAIFNCLMMTPCMVLGYLFAHNSYFERIKIDGFSKPRVIVFCCAIIIITFVLRFTIRIKHNPFQLDFFYAPMMIGAIVVLFNKFTLKSLRKVFGKMGEVSVYMWFFHALFFTTPVKWFYQPSITIFNHINLVVIWAVILTFAASWLIKSVVDHIIRLFSK